MKKLVSVTCLLAISALLLSGCESAVEIPLAPPAKTLPQQMVPMR